MKNSSNGMGRIIAAFLLLSAFYACQKNDGPAMDQPGPNQNQLHVYLTDGPGYFDEVWVDIQQIAVKIDTTASWWSDSDKKGPHGHGPHPGWGNHDTDDGGAIWDTLDIHPGSYNLLDFANGADTLMAQANIPKGKVIAFRLSLGDDNHLVKDSVLYPLELIPDWQTVYIRVTGNQFDRIASQRFRIWIDFDAGRSVIRAREGKFFLRPFLHAFAVSRTGSIQGSIGPEEAKAVISVYNDADTLYAIPGKKGQFMIRGLEEGTYQLFVNASNGYQDTTLTDLSVKAKKPVDIGPITLHQ